MQGEKQQLIVARGLGVEIGGRLVVSQVDLAIHRGEIVTLIGPNGGGKSTVARALINVISPTQGTIERAKKLKIGYVPQKLSIDWTMPLSVERFMRLTQNHKLNAVIDALAETGAAHLLHAPMQGLSGGEFQRVMIARAILSKPDLLVLDEPVQGVDHRGEIALYQLIRDIRDRLDCGVLLISHDLHIVMADSDTIVCLNGHVCCSGTPEAVSRNDAYLELFGPRAQGTLAVYRHHHDHSHDHCNHAHHHDQSKDHLHDDAKEGERHV